MKLRTVAALSRRRKRDMGFRLVPLLILAFSSSAFAWRKITVFKSDKSLSFTQDAGSGSCRLTLDKDEVVEVIGEADDYVKVRLQSSRYRGCSLFGGTVREGWLTKKEIGYESADGNPKLPLREDCDDRVMRKPATITVLIRRLPRN